jgi:hypothetical protein
MDLYVSPHKIESRYKFSNKNNNNKKQKKMTDSNASSSSYDFPSASASCLAFNNEGIEHLRQGNFDTALGKLVNSLTAAKGMLRLLGGTSQNNSGSNSRITSSYEDFEQKQRPTASIDTTSILGFDSILHIYECHSMEDDHDGQHHHHRYLYRNAFLLSSSWFEHLDYKKMLTVSVAIVFNLALTHHLRALACTDLTEQESRLFQALDLYELAHSMQRDGETMLSMEFSCAIACNLGNIHRMVGDAHRSKRCFEHLHTLMIYAQQNMDETDKFSPTATDTFTRCIFTLLLQNSIAPAA